MAIVYYEDLVQGSDEWLKARLGLLTASQLKHIVTPTLKPASNDKERALMWELLAQRITGYIEPQYWNDDMLRGQEDEVEAVMLYDKTYEQTQTMGFITNDKWGFIIGYSPDGLVGTEGLVECKSRNQKLQIKTIVDYVSNDTIDPDFMIQCQAGLIVSERQWIDQISYSGGLPMSTVRIYPDIAIQNAIIEAATNFEHRLQNAHAKYKEVLNSKARLIPTVRKMDEEIY
jgi:hypothetical protein